MHFDPPKPPLWGSNRFIDHSDRILPASEQEKDYNKKLTEEFQSPHGGRLSRASHSLSSTKSDPGQWCSPPNGASGATPPNSRFRLRRNFSSFLHRPSSLSPSSSSYHHLPTFTSLQLAHHRNLYLTVTSPEESAANNGGGGVGMKQRRVEKRESTLDEDDGSSVEPKSCCSEPRSLRSSVILQQPPTQQLLGDSLLLRPFPRQATIGDPMNYRRRNSDSSEAALGLRSGQRSKHGMQRVRGRLRNVNSLSPAPRSLLSSSLSSFL